MTNDIQLFHNDQFGDIRALAVNDEPWFVAKDVCDLLGVATNHLREEGRGLDDDEVSSLPNWEGRGSAPLIVSEPGLYKLIMRSRKPEAKAFQRWVTHEVLPALRRDGAYVASDGTEDGTAGTWTFTGWSTFNTYTPIVTQVASIAADTLIYGNWAFAAS